MCIKKTNILFHPAANYELILISQLPWGANVSKSFCSHVLYDLQLKFVNNLLNFLFQLLVQMCWISLRRWWHLTACSMNPWVSECYLFPSIFYSGAVTCLWLFRRLFLTFLLSRESGTGTFLFITFSTSKVVPVTYDLRTQL